MAIERMSTSSRSSRPGTNSTRRSRKPSLWSARCSTAASGSRAAKCGAPSRSSPSRISTCGGPSRSASARVQNAWRVSRPRIGMSRAMRTKRALGAVAQFGDVGRVVAAVGEPVEAGAVEGRIPRAASSRKRRLSSLNPPRALWPNPRGSDYIASPRRRKKKREGAKLYGGAYHETPCIAGRGRCCSAAGLLPARADERRGPRPVLVRRSRACRPTSNPSPMSIRTRPRAGCSRCRSPARREIRISRPSTRSTFSRARATAPRA